MSICQQIQGMETSEVNQLVKDLTTDVQDEDGLKIHYVLPQEEREDSERGFRKFCIGQPSDRPIRCVLLLGETGGGKTTFINAAINYLFGVKLEDPFRLRLKEAADGRMQTESQTDLITAYTIYYKEGMKYEYNFVFIDTPGQADTRGMQQQHDIRDNLEAFLTTGFEFDDLHCVGLVAKAYTNRNLGSQKVLLDEIISLLGDSVPEITNVFATFAVDKPTVDAVMINAEVAFKTMYEFDNGKLFCFQQPNSDVPFRWNVMNKQYETFIKALVSAPSVGIKILRERKLFHTCKKTLKAELETLATSMAAMQINKEVYTKYELQKAKNDGWMQEETVEEIVTVTIEDDSHAHNCYECKQTCIFPCNKCNNKNDILAGVVEGAVAVEVIRVTATAAEAIKTGAAAEAASVTAAAAEAASVTVAAAEAASVTVAAAEAASVAAAAAEAASVAVAAAEAASVTVAAAEAASVAVAATEAASVTLAAAEVASIGGAMAAAPLIASAALGIGALGIGAYLLKTGYDKMTASDADSVCGKNSCTHPLSQHIKENKMFVKTKKVQKKIDKDMKNLYDVATSKMLEVNAKTTNEKQKNLLCIKNISKITVDLLYHAKMMRELTSKDFDFIEDITCQLDNEIRWGEPNIIPHAIKLVSIIKKAMQTIVSYATEEIHDKHELVEEMLMTVDAAVKT